MKILKSRIFAFVLGLVIAGSIGVYATIKMQADEIGYGDEGKTVADALDDLYSNLVLTSSMVTEEVYGGHSIATGATLTNVDNYKAYYGKKTLFLLDLHILFFQNKNILLVFFLLKTYSFHLLLSQKKIYN